MHGGDSKPGSGGDSASPIGGIAGWYSKPGVAGEFAKYQIPGTDQYRRRSPERRAVEKIVGALPAGSSILDAPCGTGRYSCLLSRFAFSCSADVSLEMLGIAAAVPVAGGSLCAADNYRLPFADRAFDASICMRFLHHVPDRVLRRKCIAELARVTKSTIVCTYFESRSLKHLARKARAGLRGRTSMRFACRFGEIEADFGCAGFRVDSIVSPVPLLGENRILLCSRKPSASPIDSSRK